MHKNLLVAYDGSILSRKALNVAKDYAVQNKDLVIHIISVIEAAGPQTNLHMTRSVMSELAEKLQPQMDKIVEEFAAENITVTTELLGVEHKENPGELICKYANDNQIDLIIMGSRGLGNIRQVILGSVSNNIVQNAKCSVLIVKEQNY